MEAFIPILAALGVIAYCFVGAMIGSVLASKQHKTINIIAIIIGCGLFWPIVLLFFLIWMWWSMLKAMVKDFSGRLNG